MPEPRSWIIGSDPASDLVVERPSVSWHHCRLIREPDGTFAVEDLKSTNGTFVNGRRIRGLTAVRPEDRVTLGQTVPMPWPTSGEEGPASSGARVVRVGRDPDNDVVIDSPEVSGRHARVLIAAGGREAVVEDLGSTNGTSVGAPGNPVTRAAIGPSDTIYFGPVAFPAAAFLTPGGVERREAIPDLVFHGPVMTVGRDASCDFVVDFPVVSSRHARLVRAGGAVRVEDLGSSNGTFVNGTRVDPAATARAGDLIGLGGYTLRLVEGSSGFESEGEVDEVLGAGPFESTAGAPVMAGPRTLTMAARPVSLRGVAVAGIALGAQAGLLAEAVVLAAGRSPAAALFGMSLAAVWFGLTSALFERLLGAATGLGAARRGLAAGIAGSLARAALFDLFLCAVLFAAAAARLLFGGRWPAAFAVLWLTALVGSSFGLALGRLTDRLVLSLTLAVALVMMMAVVGGPNRPLPRLNRVARSTFSAMPTRWAFEALLLAWAGGRSEDPSVDPVEPFFPAQTDRSGLFTCASALLAMLGGGVYLEILIALSRPAPLPPEHDPT